jgi:hypothetical protein
MPRSRNGRTPKKTTEGVATELRRRLEQRLGHERTEAIWEDPTNVRDVLEDEDEAASVAGMILQAWRDLPEEDQPPVERRRTSAFRRGLRLALIAAVAVWALSMLNKARHGHEGP